MFFLYFGFNSTVLAVFQNFSNFRSAITRTKVNLLTDDDKVVD